MSDVLCKP